MEPGLSTYVGWLRGRPSAACGRLAAFVTAVPSGWAAGEADASARTGVADDQLAQAPEAPSPSTAEVRAWAREQGYPVSDRGRLRPHIWAAWRAAHNQ